MPMRLSASFRHWAVHSPHPVAVLMRRVRGRLRYFTLPAPKLIVLPFLWLFLILRSIIFFLRRILIAEPLFKAYCTRHGRGVTTGIFVPWIRGRGELIVGDYVYVSGKLSIMFGARFVERPKLVIGDYSDIAHETSFVVGREIRIGRHVQIAGRVAFRDSAGHPSDPARRMAGEAPHADDVKPIIVHDNVWIGVGALILPGADIGEGSIVSARAVVSGVVPPYTVVAGNPARRIGTLTPPDTAGAPGDVATGSEPAMRGEQLF
jgi:acetyltransferase-like isoleucine patch superfamily enzyme